MSVLQGRREIKQNEKQERGEARAGRRKQTTTTRKKRGGKEMWFIEMRRKEAIKADQQSHQRTPSEPAFRTAEGGTRTKSARRSRTRTSTRRIVNSRDGPAFFATVEVRKQTPDLAEECSDRSRWCSYRFLDRWVVGSCLEEVGFGLEEDSGGKRR